MRLNTRRVPHSNPLMLCKSLSDRQHRQLLNRDCSTWVYTFDSLGTRHPAVANRLGKYLQREAADKKNYPIEDTSIATYKYAKVPLQKNFCDCGLYVLYFVESFMENAAHAQQCIHKGNEVWSKEPFDLRKAFREETIALSEAWKKEKAEKEGTKIDGAGDNVGAEVPAPTLVEDSDDDIIVGDIIPAPGAKGKGGKKGGNGRATRLRG
ncbi:hypothetical protein C8Q78DRAFT_198939 [Trametes maxima]|nr:hypothetical protein C8Q78DRAFT_198939 [Trametes maxima]